MNASTINLDIPAGYRVNAVGELIPESRIKPIDRARDELVYDLAEKAKAASKALVEFKGQAFADVHAFIQLSAEQYQATIGGKKGNVTLFSFDGRYKMQVAKADSIVFDERLQAAKALVDECLKDWSKDSKPELQALVQQAFAVDKEGNISTGRVLALRRLDSSDERWHRAMAAISDSVQVVGSKQYVRFYERVGESDFYAPISLDVAKV